MNHPEGRRRMPVRRLAAWCGFGAGVGVLLILLLHSGHSGIPGWQPADEALRAALSLAEADDSPPARSWVGADGDEGSGTGDTHAAGAPATTGSPASAPAALPSDSDSLPATVPAGEPPDASREDDGRLDLNRASVSELDELPGIGPTKAQAIAELRDSRQGFRTEEELLEVKGIGPKLYDKIRDRVKVDWQAGPSAPSQESGSS